MKLKLKTILSLCILTLLISCNANKRIEGKYRSNFANLGFFITKIELKKDSTFHYEFSGDLMHKELDGKYKVENKILYLRFNKLKDETENKIVEINGKDTIVNFEDFGKTHSYDLKKENEIEYHLKYKISNEKLFVYNIQTNKIVRKAKKYSDKREYILFGSKYYNKKIYLKKVE